MSPEEEQQAFQAYRDAVPGAVELLLAAHLPRLQGYARAHASPSFPLADAFQVACLGFLRALEKFDPTRGVRLMSYAEYWMDHFLIRDWDQKYRSAIRMPTSARQQLRKIDEELRVALLKTGRGLDDAELAERLEMKIERVRELRLAAKQMPHSLEEVLLRDEMDAVIRHHMIAAAERRTPESRLQDAQLEAELDPKLCEALKGLSGLERHVILLRVMASPPLTLKEIGAQIDLSGERVRQICQQGLMKLRHRLGGWWASHFLED